jgi:hypothetical protein
LKGVYEFLDAARLCREYESSSPEVALERIRLLREACRASGGEFVPLWHNCQLTDPRWRETYARAVAF